MELLLRQLREEVPLLDVEPSVFTLVCLHTGSGDISQ